MPLPNGLSISHMSQLNTAGGPIDTADLGVSLMYEHVFTMTSEVMQNSLEAYSVNRWRFPFYCNRCEGFESCSTGINFTRPTRPRRSGRIR